MQKPHCSAWASWKARWSGCSSSVAGQALDGQQRAAVGLHGEHQARAHGLAVELDRARPADAVLAADVGAGQPGLVADEVRQQRARLDVALVTGAVDLDRDPHRVGLLDRLLHERGGQRAAVVVLVQRARQLGRLGRARPLAQRPSRRRVARCGVGPAPSSAIGRVLAPARARPRRPRWRSRRACGRARRSRCPRRRAAAGTSISTSSSSGSSTVISGASKKSRDLDDARRRGPPSAGGSGRRARSARRAARRSGRRARPSRRPCRGCGSPGGRRGRRPGASSGQPRAIRPRALDRSTGA